MKINLWWRTLAQWLFTLLYGIISIFIALFVMPFIIIRDQIAIRRARD